MTGSNVFISFYHLTLIVLSTLDSVQFKRWAKEQSELYVNLSRGNSKIVYIPVDTIKDIVVHVPVPGKVLTNTVTS